MEVSAVISVCTNVVISTMDLPQYMVLYMLYIYIYYVYNREFPLIHTQCYCTRVISHWLMALFTVCTIAIKLRNNKCVISVLYVAVPYYSNFMSHVTADEQLELCYKWRSHVLVDSSPFMFKISAPSLGFVAKRHRIPQLIAHAAKYAERMATRRASGDLGIKCHNAVTIPIGCTQMISLRNAKSVGTHSFTNPF